MTGAGYPPQLPVRPIPKNISHGAHFIATLLTFGLWFPFWAFAGWNTKRVNKKQETQFAVEMSRYQAQLAAYNRMMDRMN